jgi:hypothetical protein
LAGRPALEVAALSICRFASSRPVTAHEFAPAIDADIVQIRALVLLNTARLAWRNLRLPSLLAPFALFFFPPGEKRLEPALALARSPLSFKNKSNSTSAVPAGQRRAIELQSLGAGNRVLETKADKSYEREAIPSFRRSFRSAGSKRKKRSPIAPALALRG